MDNKKEEINKNKKGVSKIFKSIKFRMVALLAALGITTAGGAFLLGDKGNKHNEGENKTEISNDINKETEEETFKNGIKFEIPEDITQKNEEETTFESTDRVMLQLVLQYNEKYGTDLTPDDISLIESKPQALGVMNDGTYVQNYKSNSPVDYYISDSTRDKTKISEIYVIINNKTNEIIGSVGKVNYEIINVDTKIVMKYDKKEEIVESQNKMDFIEGKTKEEKERIYNTLKVECLRQDDEIVKDGFDNEEIVQ